MDFRIKCLMQSIFGVLPRSEEVNYMAQKYLSRSLPPSRATYARKGQQARAHHETFQKYADVSSATVYEIGCGWSLIQSLYFSTFGYPRVLALDVVNHVRAELLNAIISYMVEDGLLPAGRPPIGGSPDEIARHLASEYNITLMAPRDSRDTGLDEASVNCVFSQEAFEHIAPGLLPEIMAETRRIMTDDGVASIYINYGDHYSGVDKSITAYNFLKYSDSEWKKYNPRLHYVNRLRHVDYIRIFENTGFDIVDAAVRVPEGGESILSGIELADEFRTKYTFEELLPTGACFTLVKRRG